MDYFFKFGEVVKDFDVRVLNEREVRAGAGILLLFGMVVFMDAFLVGNFFPLKIFVVAFLIDFTIRLVINPKYSPSLVIGRFFVGSQEVEYVSAPQKRFAWTIGLLLVSFMFVFLVVLNLVSPINLFVCLACLAFLFFESVFGICIGCKVYSWFSKDESIICPGGVCKPIKKKDIQKISWAQIIVVILFIGLIVALPISGVIKNKSPQAVDYVNNSSETLNPDCEVPQWAIDIGHEELYKEHHGCT